MAEATQDIKSMKLYSENAKWIYNELEAHGLKDKTPLDPVVLHSMDCLHYHGTETVDEAVKELKISASSKVFDIGAGIGGPSRRIASTTGASVVGLEFQPDLAQLNTDLTAACGLSDRVSCVAGDVLNPEDLPKEKFDIIVSWLVFLHIQDRATLFKHCNTSLLDNGLMFVEDYFQRNTLSPIDQTQLEQHVFCHSLPTWNQYKIDLEAAGFDVVSFKDVTEDWTACTNARAEGFKQEYGELKKVHDDAAIAAKQSFYDVVRDLFSRGNLGGVKYICKKRASTE